MTIQTNALRNTTKPSNSTKPAVIDTAVQTEKDVFALLVECGKIESKQITVSDSLLAIAKASSDVDTFLVACRNAEKSYKAISKAHTIPRAWTQSKSDIKAMFSELSQFDNISQLKKVKNIQAADKRKADKKEKAVATIDKANTIKYLNAKHEALATKLASIPAEVANDLLDMFILQVDNAIQAVNDKPVAKVKPETKAKVAAKVKATKAKARAK